MSLPETRRAIAGVDGFRQGWIAAIRFPDGAFAAQPFARFADLLAALDGDATIAVDMPIGLLDRNGPDGRGPEKPLKKHLGKMAPAVFPIPSRPAIYAAPGPFSGLPAILEGFKEACDVARQTSEPPKAFSLQAFGLFPKIRELDALLRADQTLAARVIESHPEAAFQRLNCERPLSFKKKAAGAAGIRERRNLLLAHSLPPALLDQSFPGVGMDDLLDAAALLFSAARFARGEAKPFPDPPGRDAFGLPVAIWV